MKFSKSDIRRWFGWLALVIAFSVACVYLSSWQFDRRQQALDALKQVEQNYDSQIVDLRQVATVEEFDVKNQWRRVELVGRYLNDSAVLVRNRPLNGQAGFLQVVPFQLSSGEVVAVERGWLSVTSGFDAPSVQPLPSAELQTVIGHVRPSEPSLNREAPANQIATINIEALAAKTAIKSAFFESIYVRMQSESIAVAEAPRKLARPEISEGNHLSYALQWILFAVMALGALIWAIRKERDALSQNKKPKKRKLMGEVDAEAEDALVAGVGRSN